MERKVEDFSLTMVDVGRGQDARGAGGEVGVYGRGHWRSLHVEDQIDEAFGKVWAFPNGQQ